MLAYFGWKRKEKEKQPTFSKALKKIKREKNATSRIFGIDISLNYWNSDWYTVVLCSLVKVSFPGYSVLYKAEQAHSLQAKA